MGIIKNLHVKQFILVAIAPIVFFSCFSSFALAKKAKLWTVVDYVKANVSRKRGCIVDNNGNVGVTASDIYGHVLHFCNYADVNVSIQSGYLRGWAFDENGNKFIAKKFENGKSLKAVDVFKGKGFEHQMIVVISGDDKEDSIATIVDARYLEGDCGDCELDKVK